MLCQSRLSANNKGHNEMIPEAVHRSPGVYLTAEENPRKPQLGALQSNEVGGIAQHARKRGRRKGRKDQSLIITYMSSNLEFPVL